MKPIRFSMHARENLSYRGSTDNEVIEAIRNSTWSSVQQGSLSAERTLPTGSNGTENSMQ